MLARYVEDHPEARDLGFELARRYFELNRFDVAAERFLDVADGPASDPLGPEALLRALECFHVLGSVFGQMQYYERMTEVLPHGSARLCDWPLVRDDPSRRDTCRALHTIEVGLVAFRFR